MTVAPFELLVAALTCYRLTVLLVDDYVLEWFRDWLQWRADRSRRIAGDHLLRRRRDTSGRARARAWLWSSLHYLCTCPWCVSVWLGVAVTAGALVLPTRWFVALCAPWVCSATAGLLHQLSHRGGAAVPDAGGDDG